MAATDRPIKIDYDPRADVLYASIGDPQPALSYELSEDVLLRYVPPRREVVGITIMNFSRQYPLEGGQEFLSSAKAVIQNLLQRYPRLPFEQMDYGFVVHVEYSTSRELQAEFKMFSHETVAATQSASEDPTATFRHFGPRVVLRNSRLQVSHA
jgi:uncharacterized protein YuzE